MNASHENLIQMNKERGKKYRSDYEKSPSKCHECDSKLIYEKRNNKFCNHSCAASYNNKGISRHSDKPTDTKDKKCLFCNKKITKWHSKRKYCSRTCSNNATKAKSEKKILSGDKVGVRTLKSYLLKQRGNQCEICKNTEWCGKPIPLVMDHVDGNSENNYLKNLRLVCGNCDMQLPTYKSKNNGNGRHRRRKRYQKGQSY